MKMYNIKKFISVICIVISIVLLVLAVFCKYLWQDNMYTIYCVSLMAIYMIVGICAGHGAKEDYEEYQCENKFIKIVYYDKLSKLVIKHYWKLDIDCTVPYFKNNKKAILEWAADVAMACQTYMFDYDTENKDPQLNQELKTMTELAQEIIDNKKYL